MNLVNKILLILAVAGSFVAAKPAYAHPPDTTTTNITLPTQGLNPIKAEVLIPWSEALVITSQASSAAEPKMEMIIPYEEQIKTYISQKLSLATSERKCETYYKGMTEISQDELLFGQGIPFIFEYNCFDYAGQLVIKNSLFVDDFPTQTNIVNVYKGDENNFVAGSLLTPKQQEMVINIEGDNKGQEIKNESSDLIRGLTSKLANASIPLLLLLVFTLGFLHTAEAGHSKTVLAAAMIDKRMNFKQGAIYAVVFVVTHIADIVIMGILLLTASAFTDVYKQLPYLQLFALYALLFISMYQLFSNGAHWLQHKLGTHHDHRHEHEHEHSHEVSKKDSFGKQLMLGFVTGLAPCLFGWSIFMVILSASNIWLVIPLIAVFGLGIFAALILFAYIISKVKSSAFDKLHGLGELSPIISALILVIYSLSQII